MIAAGIFDGPVGATPLNEEDREGLIPTWIADRDELNAAEKANIAKALQWTESRGGPHSVDTLMTEKMMKVLHQRMFGDVWKWAGDYTRHNTNIGADWPYISVQLRDLLADVVAQTADPDNLPWPADELGIRFHHRLVLVHPFPDGNGRHSRLAADLLVELLGEQPFTWGGQNPGAKGSARQQYLDALRHADRAQGFEPMVAFARS